MTDKEKKAMEASIFENLNSVSGAPIEKIQWADPNTGVVEYEIKNPNIYPIEGSMEDAAPESPKEDKFFTGSHNSYAYVGKNKDGFLGVSVQYVVHPKTGVGFLLVRFVSTGKKKTYATFHNREVGEFKTPEGDGFQAHRLDKVGIPVFNPGPPPIAFVSLGDKFLIWEVVANWIAERCKENGFDIIVVDLKTTVKKLVSGEVEVDDSNYSFVLEFPTLEGKK